MRPRCESAHRLHPKKRAESRLLQILRRKRSSVRPRCDLSCSSLDGEVAARGATRRPIEPSVQSFEQPLWLILDISHMDIRKIYLNLLVILDMLLSTCS